MNAKSCCCKVHSPMAKVIIIGGGFAGVEAAKTLARENVEVLLIDKNNHHVFQPLLYQVATATLNPGDISFPLRVLFSKHENVSVLMGTVTSIDFPNNQIFVGQNSYQYDYLIISAGAETAYFGHDDWRKFTYELKTIDDAILIRNKFLSLLEEKELKKEKRLTISIVGAGPTGVELAGTIGEFFKFTEKHEYKNLESSDFQIYLIDKAPRVLLSFSNESSRKSEQHLKELGVKFIPNADITEISENLIHLNDSTIESDLIIWTAGVQGKSLKTCPEVKHDRGRKIICLENLSIREFPNVFVCGDLAILESTKLPGVAPVAIQQGRWAAKNIMNQIYRRPLVEFKYVDSGSMAVIGRKFAVAKIKGIEFTGFFAWLIWCFVHIFPLVSFRNRALVFFEFVWSYFNVRRGVRIISNFRK